MVLKNGKKGVDGMKERHRTHARTELGYCMQEKAHYPRSSGLKFEKRAANKEIRHNRMINMLLEIRELLC